VPDFGQRRGAQSPAAGVHPDGGEPAVVLARLKELLAASERGRRAGTVPAGHHGPPARCVLDSEHWRAHPWPYLNETPTLDHRGQCTVDLVFDFGGLPGVPPAQAALPCALRRTLPNVDGVPKGAQTGLNRFE